MSTPAPVTPVAVQPLDPIAVVEKAAADTLGSKDAPSHLWPVLYAGGGFALALLGYLVVMAVSFNNHTAITALSALKYPAGGVGLFGAGLASRPVWVK